MKQLFRWTLALGVAAGSFSMMSTAAMVAADTESQQQASQTVPADLKPLLAEPASEMRLVVTRYNADRSTLSGNYAGAGRRGGGRAAAAAGGGGRPAPVARRRRRHRGPVPFSPARLARLKRYDLDWQAALGEARHVEAVGGRGRPTSPR